MDILNRYSIRLGLSRAKALQTAIRFPRETRRRFAVPKSNAFPLDFPSFSRIFLAGTGLTETIH
jgi:hypothetical protein